MQIEIDSMINPFYIFYHDSQTLMKKHRSGMNALILVVSNDVRKKQEDKKEEKELTNEQKEAYFKCVELIMGAIDDENKAAVLMEKDDTQNNALMWCCTNGNIQSAQYLLKECPDEKTRSSIIEQRDEKGENSFHKAIYGGNIELIWKNVIHSEEGPDMPSRSPDINNSKILN